MNCEIIGCTTSLSAFHPSKPRIDGIAVQVLSTGRIYMICNACAKRIGLVK